MDKTREKNRLAAANCRPKKRLSHDVLEETYRTASAVNSAMRRQSRELRDQLAHIRLLVSFSVRKDVKSSRADPSTFLSRRFSIPAMNKGVSVLPSSDITPANFIEDSGHTREVEVLNHLRQCSRWFYTARYK